MQSISTPDFFHKQKNQYLTELYLVEKYPQLKDIKYFWRDDKNKNMFKGATIQISRRLKYIDFDLLKQAIIESKTKEFLEIDQILESKLLKP